jgi:hypothetical protein
MYSEWMRRLAVARIWLIAAGMTIAGVVWLILPQARP